MVATTSLALVIVDSKIDSAMFFVDSKIIRPGDSKIGGLMSAHTQRRAAANVRLTIVSNQQKSVKKVRKITSGQLLERFEGYCFFFDRVM